MKTALLFTACLIAAFWSASAEIQVHTCTYEGIEYPVDTPFRPNPCTWCHCYSFSSTPACAVALCGMPACMFPQVARTLPGNCCPSSVWRLVEALVLQAVLRTSVPLVLKTVYRTRGCPGVTSSKENWCGSGVTSIMEIGNGPCVTSGMKISAGPGATSSKEN
ncbi:hypothetical protein PoB_007709800 [Plakobranchus ocellatus]|uniref:VWFC domain-containing protein n=1 Tax=Plakobranchus ocellatus TaxID=259542 RepID=A0AAV4E1V5_9GAST|nr:hypothetical protein PoB_007709800 [Plakobranchus ocellatus]